MKLAVMLERLQHTASDLLYPLVLVALLVSGLTDIRAQEPPERYSIIRLIEPSRADLEAVSRLGIEAFSGPRQRAVTLYVNPRELQALRDRGIAPQVIHPDATDYFARRLHASLGPGSMGGYYTLAEVETWMDSMATAHSDIISPRFGVGTSIEGRTIWAFIVSDDPDPASPDLTRPAVFYNSLIHAREAIGMMVLLGFVEDLAGEYDSGDADVRYLLSSRELWFVPVLNPDGYSYNELTAAAGGGMWRKNMRDNDGDGVFNPSVDGVDLNRNFGFHWGEDDIGSSPDFSTSNYRGTAPFSEPETRAVRDVVQTRPFEFILNYHSYSDVYIHPWGYTTETVDRVEEYRAWCRNMAAVNGFPYGTDATMIGYHTNGSATDWQHGAEGVLAVIPEVGNRNDAFWPATSRIAELTREHMGANYITAWMAGALLTLDERAFTASRESTAAFPVDGTRSGMFSQSTTWKNAGISRSLESVTAAVTSLSANITVLRDQILLGDFAVGESRAAPEPFTFQIGPEAYGRRIPIAMRVDTPAGYTRTDTLALYAGTPEILLTENWERGTGDWTLINGFTLSSHTPSGEDDLVTDAPLGEVTFSQNWFDLNDPVILSGYEGAFLSFSHRPTLGDRNLGLVTISTIPRPRADPGEIDQERDPILFFTTGSRSGWEEARIDLSPYLAAGDLWLSWYSKYADLSSAGWSIDNISITAWNPSTACDEQLTMEPELLPPYPNPSNPSVSNPITLRLDLSELGPGETAVTIRIFDTRGRLIRRLFSGVLANIYHDGTIRWNSRSETGQYVPTGIYIIELSAQGMRRTRKMLILR